MRTILLSLLLIACSAAQEKPPGPRLPHPLRKFDANNDGLLTGDEERLARQAHKRGGRDAEPNPGRWREILDRLENEFQRRRAGDFDLNGDGKTEGPEREEMKKVWHRIAERYTAIRPEITAKYDRNDDGELDEKERDASRTESERRRREVEDALIGEWRAARQKK